MNSSLRGLAGYATLLALSLGLAACGTFKRSHIGPEIRETSGTAAPSEVGYQPNPEYGHVDIPMNPKVKKWIKYFTGRGRKHMQLYLERSSRYMTMMRGVFRERGMPDELAYVAMIESGFSALAHSHASAVGYWQFIRGTGKRYGLKIDRYVDERRDPILSTQAAATYLDSLYNLFGDWHLALAAYNSGENRVQRAVMKNRTRDFWELTSKRRVLPRETMNYVPKFIAAIYIGKDPARYGFTNIDFQPEFEFETVVLEKPISLELMAQNLSLPYDDLKKMNPRYKSDFVPLYSDRQNAVRVPVGRVQDAVAVLEKSFADAPRRYLASFEYYRVRRGDTLSHIARRFRTSVSRIRDLNDWGRRRSFIRIGQRIKVPDGPVASKRRSRRSGSSSRVQKRSIRRTAHKYHRIRRGENLSLIAKKYNLSLGELRRLNKLGNRSKIFPGRKLLVAKGTAGSKVSRSVAGNGRRDRVHVVRRGENLTLIARRYKTTVGEIARANSLNTRATLFVGKNLVIPD